MIAVFARKSTPCADKIRKIKQLMDKDYLPKIGRRIYLERMEAVRLYNEVIAGVSEVLTPDPRYAPEGHWIFYWGFEVHIYEDNNESC